MADILIRGMEMPENCRECRFAGFGGIRCELNVCMFSGESQSLLSYERMSKCPLVPLPEKHGRLGDLDAVCKDIVLYRDVETCEAERGNNTQHLERAYGANETLCIVCDAPTIIPAEGRTEE